MRRAKADPSRPSARAGTADDSKTRDDWRPYHFLILLGLGAAGMYGGAMAAMGPGSMPATPDELKHFIRIVIID